jgi:hypothetical protein
MASIRTTQIGDILEIKKISQCYSNILTNHTDHSECQYPKTTNPDEILHVGTQLKVLDKGKAETKWAQSYVTVSYKGKEFDILASDLRRFCK